MNSLKEFINGLADLVKWSLLLFFWLGAYSLGLELIQAYRADKAQCEGGSLNKHNAIETDATYFALTKHNY